jgi:hypothetical protein
VVAVAATAAFAGPARAGTTFPGGLKTQPQVASTLASNGEINRHGVVVVPRTADNPVRGDALVSNFYTGPPNQQGWGSTIVDAAPTGT